MPAVTPPPSVGGSVPTNISAFNNDMGYVQSNQLALNEFGGVGASTWVAQGVVISSGIIAVMLPIMSSVKPASITVISTFEAVKIGVSALGDVTININVPASSNKIAYLQCSGLTGLTVGDVVGIRAKTETSKLTVNF